MRNSEFQTNHVKKVCEDKLHIRFRDAGEYNGWFILDGRKVARITVPKGRKFIPQGTYGNMARQLKLTVSQFDELLDCPLKKPRFEQILRARIDR